MTTHITENGGTFPCPFCRELHPCAVMDSRVSARAESYRRRRVCRACGRRFTTYEAAEIGAPRISKRDGSTEVFSRDKLYRSLFLALGKHPTEQARADIARIADNIADEVSAQAVEQDIYLDTGWLRTRAEHALRGPARVRYASFGMTLMALGGYCQRLMRAHEATR